MGTMLLRVLAVHSALLLVSGGSGSQEPSPVGSQWTAGLRSQPGQPPPKIPAAPGDPGNASSALSALPVPYSPSPAMLLNSTLLESLNHTHVGRQLLPLLAAGLSASDQQGAYLLGFSHNPWGASSALIHDEEALHEVLGQLIPAPSSQRGPSRSRRSVVHLYNMLVCATGCNPMAFKGYGCYCGFLGSGYTVDGIDRCCKMHDWCYDSASCPMFLEYFVPYLWKCYRRRPICALNGSSCSQRLCECDRRLAECLRRYPCPRRKAVCTSSPWRLLQNLFML